MLTRRLIGPTFISLALFGLLFDHLFLHESRWSVSRFLGKVFVIASTIVAPVADPALYSRIGTFLVSLGLVLFLLSLILSRAKRDMSRATPDANVATPTPVRKTPVAPEPVDVSKETLLPATKERRPGSLLNNWLFSFGTVGALLNVAICLIVFAFLSRAIEKQMKDRIHVMALGLGEVVAPALAARNIEAVAEAVARYASTNSVAYIYIEDLEGRIIAHWPTDLPRHLRRDFPNSTERALQGTDGEYRRLEIFELAGRIGDGRSGFIHLAIGRQTSDTEAQRVVAVIGAAIFVLLFGAIGFLLLLVRPLHRPFAELVDNAEQISKGDFAARLALQNTDELGEIARSLERLRSSLRAVTARLEHGLRRSNE